MNYLNRKNVFAGLKATFLAAVLAVGAVPAFAQEQVESPATQLLIHLIDGNEEYFQLADSPVITFEGLNCVIKSKDYEVTFPMSEIKEAKLVDENVAVAPVAEAKKVTIDLTNPNFAVVNGIEPGAPVNVYAVTGTLVATGVADNQGRAEVDLSGLQAGSVYIVSVDSNNNFKLYKK